MSVATDERVTTLSAAFDDYPHTLPLKRGEITSPRIKLAFTDIKPANRFFKPMVRELKFDVSEMAVGTLVQAKAYGKAMVLLPATIMGRFQQGTMLCRASHPLTPAELPGKRVGIRSYSQTTIMWVRGILQNDYGVDINRIQWVTQEDGHVAEYREPAEVERVSADKNLLDMLRSGEVDAAIYGANLPNDPAFTTVIPNSDAAAQAWFAKHKVVPINHMVVVTEKLAKSNPDAVRELYRLLLRGKEAAAAPKPGAIDFLPYGIDAVRPGVETVIKYALQQNLIPRKITFEELFDDTTRLLGK